MEDRIAISVEEAARMVGLSRAAFYPIVMAGDVPSVKVGARRLVPMNALREWMDRQLASAR